MAVNKAKTYYYLNPDLKPDAVEIPRDGVRANALYFFGKFPGDCKGVVTDNKKIAEAAKEAGLDVKVINPGKGSGKKG